MRRSRSARESSTVFSVASPSASSICMLSSSLGSLKAASFELAMVILSFQSKSASTAPEIRDACERSAVASSSTRERRTLTMGATKFCGRPQSSRSSASCSFERSYEMALWKNRRYALTEPKIESALPQFWKRLTYDCSLPHMSSIIACKN
eukprot:Amastigsp_a175649_316.p2 type:complete len:151 gc:universal Amastigsp_a175649_316:78-530(+)